MYQTGPFIESGRVNRTWNPFAPRSTDDICPYRIKSGCYGLSGVGQVATPTSSTVLWILGAVVAAGLAMGGLDALTRRMGR